VHLVDDVDLVAISLRCIGDAITELSDLTDAAIGGSIDLKDIEGAARGDLDARRAGPTSVRARALFTVERARKDTSGGGLTDAPRAAEEKGVMDAILLNGMGERPCDVVLTRDGIEGLRAPLSCEYEIRHG
jgi:hypothetical protein